MSSTEEHLTPGGRFNARLGIFLFLIYLVVYGIFMVLCAFAPAVMSRTVFEGLNVATVYGFSLIALAFVLALIYMLMCRVPAPIGDGGM